MTYSFCIKGPPVRYERVARGKYGQTYDPSARAKKALGNTLLGERVAARMSVLGGEVRLTVSFYLPTRKGRKSGRKSDFSNHLKAFEDAANGILWRDDAQIVEVRGQLFRESADPRTEVTVQELSVGVEDGKKTS